MSAIVETRTAKVYLDQEGIIRNYDFPGLEHHLADAEENVAAYYKVAEGARRPLFVDMSQVRSVKREARAYYGGATTAGVVSAVALLVGSPLSAAIANFFLGLNKTTMPSKLFTSEEAAFDWLRKHK